MKFPTSIKTISEKFKCEPHPIDILEHLCDMQNNGGSLSDVVCLEGTNVICGDNLSIQPFTVLSGPIFFGNNVRVGPHCFLRGPLYIEDDVGIGCGVEVCRSVLLRDCKLTHKCVVVDSIIGECAWLAGGVLATNKKFNNRDVLCDGKTVSKLGCVLGNNARIAAGVVLMPGCVVQDGEVVYK